MRFRYTARESVPGERWQAWTADERDEARAEVLARLLAHATDHGRVIAGPIEEATVVDTQWRCVHVTATVPTEDGPTGA